MKVWITGANGMVGRNLQEGAPVNLTLLTPSRSELDLSNFQQVKSFVKQNSPDVVIHAAGLVGGIQANIARPLDFFIQNLEIGKNVVLASFEAGIKKFLNLGSSCMYPRNAPNPLKEELILTGELEPTNEGYALAKISIARLCDYIRTQHPEFSYKTLIPCNLYGKYDKFDPKHSHMIPAVILKMHLAKLRGDKTLEIWGDGLARREFMYAGDLSRIVWTCLEKLEELPPYLNVGLGHDYSILEYYKAVSRVLEYLPEYTFDLSKPTGMKQKLVDVSLMKNLGLTSQESLDSGLKKTYQYFLEECQ